MKYFNRLISTVTAAILIFMILLPVNAQVNYDIKYFDTSDDVREYGENKPTNVSGYKNIDILEVESKKALIKQDLTFKLRVAGKIMVADEYIYGLYILDGETEIYAAVYQNGTCLGIDLQDTNLPEDILLATGGNTDTLQITIPIKNFGVVSSFDFYAYASKFEERNEFFYEYLDYAPNRDDSWDDWENYRTKIVYITEPLNGSTVYEILTIKGLTNIDEEEIEYIELQFDTSSSQGWKRVTTRDDWASWSYQWDTRATSDGRHTIRARAFNGAGYFYDNITVFIDQLSATNPEACTVSNLDVGDRFEYSIYSTQDQAEAPDETVTSLNGKINIKIERIKTITINTDDYEVFEIDLATDYEMKKNGDTTILTATGQVWVRTSDLAVVKEEMEIEATVTRSGINEKSITNELNIYEPPVMKFNFPLRVSDAWEVKVQKTTESTTTTMNGGVDKDKTELTQDLRFDCLRTETVVVQVGAFETFLVYGSPAVTTFGMNYDDISNNNKYNTGSEQSNYDEEITGYSIDYFSPELGYNVKNEVYNEERELVLVTELVLYEHEEQKSNAQSSSGFIEFGPNLKMPVELCIILILIIISLIIILIALILRKRRKELDRILIEKYSTQDNKNKLK